MAYIARTNGTREEITDPSLLKDFDYLRTIVGGYLERVAPIASPEIIFLCNEEGLIKGLDHNEHGTQLYCANEIVGNIVVMTRSEARKAGWL